jgi:hypothetical protein
LQQLLSAHLLPILQVLAASVNTALSLQSLLLLLLLMHWLQISQRTWRQPSCKSHQQQPPPPMLLLLLLLLLGPLIWSLAVS